MADIQTPKIELINWKVMGIWKFNIAEDECQICKSMFVEQCIQCSISNKNNSVCNVVKGKCGHAFHKHCIDKCLSSLKSNAQICPICTTPWSIEINNMDDNELWRKVKN